MSARTRNSRRRGFTLLEVLVASLLLGMLLTILTMIFNSSAIAWRTGKAGISQLSRMRRHLALAHNRADSLLPRVSAKNKSEVGYVTSAWNVDGTVRTRAVSKMDSDIGFNVPSFNSLDTSASSMQVPAWAEVSSLGSFQSGSAKTYTVGVRSYGPDRLPDTEDDITTWPIIVE